MRLQKSNHAQSKEIFAILASEIRQNLIKILYERPLTFTELSRALNISSSKLNFHLKKMDGVLIEKKDYRYHLTTMGNNALEMTEHLALTQYPSRDLIKIASIGIIIDPYDVNYNIKEALKCMDLIGHHTIDLYCLPFILATRPISVKEISTPFLKRAKDLQTHISFGLFERMNDKKYYSTVLVGPEGNIEVYRCLHRNLIFNPEIEIGDKMTIVDTEFGKIGLICANEYIYPELFTVLKLKGADYVVCPAFGMQEKVKKIIQSILVTRAIESQLVVAFSSSSFFKEEALGALYSPYGEIQFARTPENASVKTISLIDVRKSREYFEYLFSGRTNLHRELLQKSRPNTTANLFNLSVVMFPLRKVVKKYKVLNKVSIQYEETAVFEKPSYVNIPMMGYTTGNIPLKDAANITWFDDFGPISGVITKKDPTIEFLVPNRLASTSRKFYSMSFRCKTAEPIRTSGANVFVNLGFEDFNKAFTLYNIEIDEFEVQLIVNQKFSLIKAKPIYSSVESSRGNAILLWRWTKPKKIPNIKVKLSRTSSND